MRVLAALCLLLLWPFHALAQEPPVCTGKNLYDEIARTDPKLHAEIEAEAKAIPNGEAIFWKIEGKNGAGESWLYGTAHLSDPRITELAPGAEDAIAEARVVALEIKEAADHQTMAIATMRHARFLAMPSGKSLWAMVDDKDEDVIKANPNFPAERHAVFDAYQPWVVAMALAYPRCEQLRVAAGLGGVDQIVARLGLAHGLEIVGLETLEEQLGVLAGMPLDMQVRYLVSTAKAGALITDYTETLVQLYVVRKLSALLPLAKRLQAPEASDLEIMAFVERDLVAKRNYLMRDRALALIDQGNAFIAVGALHLPGKDGLVALLRQAGYKVTPLN